jgi:hypothetical protein
MGGRIYLCKKLGKKLYLEQLILMWLKLIVPVYLANLMVNICFFSD